MSDDQLRLKVTHGNAAGTEIAVADELLIGRQVEGDGKLADDNEISRRHARIARTAEGSYVVEDLGSTNGTIVNGNSISSVHPLVAGDEVEVGGSRLVVQGTAAEPATAEPSRRHAPTVVTDIPPEMAAAAPSPPETAEAPAAEVPPAAAPPDEDGVEAPVTARVRLLLELDLAAGEATIELDEGSDRIRLAHDSQDGRWRLLPGD